MVSESVSYLISNGSSLRDSFFKQTSLLQKRLSDLADQSKDQIYGFGGPITSLVLGSNQRALSAMIFLRERNIDVRAIRHPTVPEEEALLRITLPLSRAPDELQLLMNSLDIWIEESQ